MSLLLYCEMLMNSVTPSLKRKKRLYSKMVLYTRDNGEEIISTGTVFKNGQTEPDMKECGPTARLAERGNFGM